jgi:uncharacterized protein (DUF433 family)
MYGWAVRVEAWAAEQDRAAREALIKDVVAMRKRHVDMAVGMLAKAIKALHKLPDYEMTMQDIVRAIDVATKLERISRGEATERTERQTQLSGNITGRVTVAKDSYDELTTEELRKLLRIAEEQEQKS